MTVPDTESVLQATKTSVTVASVSQLDVEDADFDVVVLELEEVSVWEVSGSLVGLVLSSGGLEGPFEQLPIEAPSIWIQGR